MTKTQKEEVRADRLKMSAVEVALKWGITRQRVYQIVHERQDGSVVRIERAKELPFGGLIHFSSAKLQHLNDADLQQAIRVSALSDKEAGRQFDASTYAVHRIRGTEARQTGRPKSREDSAVRAARRREKMRSWRAQHPEIVAGYDRTYRERNPEKYAESSRARYQRRREKHLAAARKRYLEYRPEDVAARKAWKARNPEKVREQRARSYEKKRKDKADLTGSS